MRDMQTMKNALITGAGGRLGRAIAKRMIADGWFILLADVDEAAAQDAALQLGNSKSTAAVRLDVTQVDILRTKVDEFVGRYGAITALVNAAGGRKGADIGPFTEQDPSAWRPIIDLHLRGVLNCCYTVVPHMIAAKQGSIVSIAAVEGLRGDPAGAVFSAAKAGVIVLTETLVRELQPHGIRINTVVPANPDALAWSGSNDDSGDVGEAVAFLTSDRARQITGTCMDVTGGWALH